MWYAIAQPSQYLVLTGAGIGDIQIRKKALCTRISVSPYDYSLSLQAMTIEKLQFCLPAVFTIGPDNNKKALRRYALILSGCSQGVASASASDGTSPGQNHVHDIVRGIIEGETHVIVSSMSMEEIFKERQVFKSKGYYNANVKELQDAPGSEYFASLSRKVHEGAHNQAKIDVAEARMKGEIGEAEKQGRTKQELSKIDADAAVLETKRKAEKVKADSELTNRKTELDCTIQLNKISAQRQTEMRDAELQKQVETKRAETELERLRAEQVTRSQVDRETAQETADAAYYTEQKAAEARLYRQKMEADAAFYRNSKEAEAVFTTKKREAEGVLETAKAYGSLKLADANGRAINGLQPKITTWNTGNSGHISGDSMGSIRSLIQGLPPLLSTIHEQTGISPPSWFAEMPKPETDDSNLISN
ncbi:flotillin domain protein [Aspergillus heteromorphus CBS 117.55]|uniref:Flotillin domain protein n=1 Tax=Aspergillus heteromorphus CBS 117.55 TaxID=1448321 RepID=A0A317V7U6_9EURO|nr:flotillin domain protein [Aspergillus heteromorphus CBS 117.55]PWY70434.1 flotillin domain protein [Aspergillus heteromorphus CBS 117.55]